MTAETIHVTGGIDTHSDTHHAAALDQVGRLLGTSEFRANPAGYHQRAQGFFVVANPPQGMRQRASGIGDHKGITGVGLAFARIQIGDPAHRQTGKVGDRDPTRASHRDRQRSDRRRLVDHHQDPATDAQLIQQRAKACLIVRQRTIDQTAATAIKRNRMMDLPGNIDAAEDLVALLVRFHQRHLSLDLSDRP
jgi:hypothetical protein